MNVRLDGKRLYIEGGLDAETVPALFDPGLAAVRNGAEVVDLAKVTTSDSSAVAICLALMREAETAGRKLTFLNVPPTMVKLSRLYAVGDLLGAPS